MDYLDPIKQRQQRSMLFLGYFLIGVAIAMGTSILVQSAYGYGVNRQGAVIQSGLLFFSSQPNPATIFTNGVQQSVQTNTRLSLPAGIYDIQLKRDGYQAWQRKVNLEGGRVAHFDYPLLVPNALSPKKSATYDGQPIFTTQSPDRRWLLVAKPNNVNEIDIYDLKQTTRTSTTINLPSSLFTKFLINERFSVVEWSGDNQHILIKHDFDNKSEFAVVDRNNADKSFNINQTLAINPVQISLRDKKYDKYYFMNASDGRLFSASVKEPAPVTELSNVLAYKSYANDTILYATNTKAPSGKVVVNLKINDKTYKIRFLRAGSNYLLDLATYSGKMYVAAGATQENKLYIYKDPLAQINKNPNLALAPAQVLHVTQPNYLSFSDTAQFIMIENGQEFAVYDLENKVGHHYISSKALDSPQQHAEWMDGHRIIYTSNGKMFVFDYDYANQHELVSAHSGYVPSFSPDVKRLYTFVANPNGQVDLNTTSMLTPKDQ